MDDALILANENENNLMSHIWYDNTFSPSHMRRFLMYDIGSHCCNYQ